MKNVAEIEVPRDCMESPGGIEEKAVCCLPAYCFLFYCYFLSIFLFCPQNADSMSGISVP